MRSRADGARRARGELALRIVALAALAGWIALAARPAIAPREVVPGTSLNEALPRWTRDARLDSIHVRLDSVPDAHSLAWLAALRGAGVGVSWSGGRAPIPDVALETFPASDPAGGVIVLTSGTRSDGAVISDALGPVDTLPRARAPAIIHLAAVEGTIALISGSQAARAGVGTSVAPGRVYVSGAAGWEAKFVVAALEERGWKVDARLFVAPDRDITQGIGARTELDTSRYAAVVLLDSAAAESARGVEAYVRAGGGVVLAGDASRASRIAALIAWRANRRESAPLGTLPGDTAWRGLSRLALDPIAERSAIALERRDGAPVVAVRRHHAGRVAAVGYDQTWRWRMAGGDSGRVEHRDWWSRVVASVAHRPASATAGQATGAAPLAALHAALGPPSASMRALPSGFSPSALANALGVLMLAALLAEWWLRRQRGAR